METPFAVRDSVFVNHSGHNWPATVFRIPPLFESPYFPAQNDFPEFQPSFETDFVFLDGLSPVPGFCAPYESHANIPRNSNHALKLSWANDPLPALGKLDISLDLQEKFASLQPGQHIPRDWSPEVRALCKKWRRVMAERKYNQSGPGKMRRVRYALKIKRGGGLKNKDDLSPSPDSQRSPVSPDGSP